MELPRVNSYTSRTLLSHSTTFLHWVYNDISIMQTISVKTLKSKAIYLIICNPP